MLDLNKLSKLTVGDIADYEAWRRDRRKRELIDTTKELYGDDIPSGALVQIEDELRKMPSLLDDNDDAFDLIAAQYLFWKSLSKKDPDITMKQVGDLLEPDANLEKYAAMLFPTGLVESKKKPKAKSKAVTRKARKKKKKK